VAAAQIPHLCPRASHPGGAQETDNFAQWANAKTEQHFIGKCLRKWRKMGIWGNSLNE